MPLSDYDADQVIRRVYDEVNNRLRVDAQITASIGSIEVTIDAASGDNIAISDPDTGYTANITVDGNLQTINMAQLVTKEFDHISAAYPLTTQEVYTYKSGGPGGSTVATVTVNYTDSTKNIFSNVTVT